MKNMQPRLFESKPILLAGMSFYGDPFESHLGWDEENQIGTLWKRLMSFLSQSVNDLPIPYPPKASYEVHIYDGETGEKGLFEVFVGIAVDAGDITNIPVELSVKILPATQYAVFTFQGDQITSDWEMTLQKWLTSSGHINSFSYNFQYYDERFKGMDRLEESILDVYIPIKKVI